MTTIKEVQKACARAADEVAGNEDYMLPYRTGAKWAAQRIRALKFEDADHLGGWISVSEKLPEPFDPKLKKPQVYLCYVEDATNLYGGIQMILAYGQFEFCDLNGDIPDSDEDGLVKRFGWHYERESEGEFDSLIFDMNGKVSHWMLLPDKPGEPK